MTLRKLYDCCDCDQKINKTWHPKKTSGQITYAKKILNLRILSSIFEDTSLTKSWANSISRTGGWFCDEICPETSDSKNCRAKSLRKSEVLPAQLQSNGHPPNIAGGLSKEHRYRFTAVCCSNPTRTSQVNHLSPIDFLNDFQVPHLCPTNSSRPHRPVTSHNFPPTSHESSDHQASHEIAWIFVDGGPFIGVK